MYHRDARDLAMSADPFNNTLRHLLSEPGPDAQILDIDGLAVSDEGQNIL